MAKKVITTSQDLRDRIVELRRIPARDLIAHENNFRRHPEQQRVLLAAVLREIGVAGALLVYQSERYGGTVCIDGHLRKADYPDQAWPCLVTDLNDEEADELLTMYDPLSALAEPDPHIYSRLIGTVQSGESAIQQFLSEQAGIPPNFGPVGIDEQGRLDEAAPKDEVECPSCGCRFAP